MAHFIQNKKTSTQQVIIKWEDKVHSQKYGDPEHGAKGLLSSTNLFKLKKSTLYIILGN